MSGEQRVTGNQGFQDVVRPPLYDGWDGWRTPLPESDEQGVVYTVNLGGKDALRPPLYDWKAPWPACRFVRFTDQAIPDGYQGWENVMPDQEIADPRLMSRYYKTMPHKHFPTAPWTIYMDATHQWREDPAKLAADILTKVQIATFSHYFTAQDEYRQICRNYAENAEQWAKQREQYIGAGFDYEHIQLRMGGFLFRRNAPEVNALNERWWEELKTWGMRDQIPLTYLIWLLHFPCGALAGDPYFHPWFTYTHHDGQKGTCYPHWFGHWPKRLRQRMRASLPHSLQYNWYERVLNRWLSRFHGDEPDHQWKYYRCLSCRKLVSWKQLHTRGCCYTCGIATKVQPARIGRVMTVRLLLCPWSVK